MILKEARYRVDILAHAPRPIEFAPLSDFTLQAVHLIINIVHGILTFQAHPCTVLA